MSKESFSLPNGEDYRIKNDEYRRNRGGSSELLEIACSKCGGMVMIYQKDGIGSLKRCYLDRVVYTSSQGEIKKDTDPQPVLKCQKCDQIIGKKIVYKPEKRDAYGLVPGSFSKKKYKPEDK